MFWRKKSKVIKVSVQDYTPLLELIFIDTYQTQCYYLTGGYLYDGNFKDEEHVLDLPHQECRMLTDYGSADCSVHQVFVENTLGKHCKDIIQNFYKDNAGKVVLFADANTGKYIATGWYLIREETCGIVTWVLKARYRVLEVGND